MKTSEKMPIRMQQLLSNKDEYEKIRENLYDERSAIEDRIRANDKHLQRVRSEIRKLEAEPREPLGMAAYAHLSGQELNDGASA